MWLARRFPAPCLTAGRFAGLTLPGGGRRGSLRSDTSKRTRNRRMDRPSPAVVLLSGGLDSTTTLAIARGEGCLPYALTFRYGQRHTVEIEAAHRVAAALGVVEHAVIDIDLRRFG